MQAKTFIISYLKFSELVLIVFVFLEASMMQMAVISRFGFRTQAHIGGWSDDWDTYGRAFNGLYQYMALGFILLTIPAILIGISLIVILYMEIALLPKRNVVLTIVAAFGWFPAIMSMVAFME